MAKSKNSKVPKNIQSQDLKSDSGNGYTKEEKAGLDKTDGRDVVNLGADPLDAAPEDGEWDLDDHRLYLNRELTWLNFNRRVLRESEDQSNPLFERLKFMAIVSSNLDEFFMKRIGGLKQLIGANFEELSVDGRTPSQQIEACYDAVDRFEREKTDVFHELVRELKNQNIYLLHYEELTEQEKDEARQYFTKNIYPLVTPQGIDPAHPFPFISNLSMNLLVTIKHPRHDELAMARVKVPVGQDLPRFIQLGNSYRYVYLDEVMRENLDILFPDVEIKSCKFFRVTRNANTEREEEKAEDLLELIESELRERKFAPIVRAQVRKGLDAIHKRFLSRELNLDEQHDLFETESMLGKHDLFELTDLNFPVLKVKPHHPIDHPRLQDTKTIFKTLQEKGDILLYHPFDSFGSSVQRFLKEASEDPNVRAIKMTLYRTSRHSKIISYLINAVQNGKQVAVVVELKARFDEEANIHWANQLEEKGIHVTYGVVGYKTHTKAIMVVRKDYDGLRRYSHIGTGNYHAVTARQYTDLGLLTADEKIGDDLTEFFNYLTTGYAPKRKYTKILVAPHSMKKELLGKIRREIKVHKKSKPGKIQIKCNALEDRAIVHALYEAGKAGVQVDLIVRDTCRIRPGIKNLSETIHVRSIIGRFLEHARIYYFQNDGNEEYYIGSADAMHRNLDSRVEILTPVEDTKLKKELRKIIEVQLEDRQDAWIMASDGSYSRAKSESELLGQGSQEYMMEIAEKRHKYASKLKSMKTRGRSKKEYWSGY